MKVEATKIFKGFNPLNANPTKWLNTLKQFLGNSRLRASLTILWGSRLKD